MIACAPGRDEAVEQKVREFGASYEPLRLHRTGMNPISDFRGFAHLFRLIRRCQPDIVLGYTIKPVIYGSIAARLAGVPKICSIITGLGYSFTRQSVINRVVRFLYRVALRRNDLVFFQNRDDEEEFRRLGILPAFKLKPEPETSTRGGAPRTVVISGSGVDLVHYAAAPLREELKLKVEVEGSGRDRERTRAVELQKGRAGSANSSPPNLTSTSTCRLNFLLIARLLRDKGIVEFCEAAKRLKGSYPSARFQILGPYDANPAALTEEEMNAWVDEGAIEYLGEASDVRPFLAACDVYVLPSYREGTPRTVLEAMATARPIITTDAPGCRETVKRKSEKRKSVRSEMPRQSGGPPPSEDSSVPLQLKLPTSTAPPGVIRGENGFLVPVRDVESLGWAMEQLILNPELRTRMGLASREFAEQRYNVHKVNAVILEELAIGGA